MTATEPRHEYVDTRRAAAHLGIKFHTMNCWRSRGEGPPFCRIGGRVRYRIADLDAWAERRRRDPSERR
jgi:predicted site-specific integrase-resolvase